MISLFYLPKIDSNKALEADLPICSNVFRWKSTQLLSSRKMKKDICPGSIKAIIWLTEKTQNDIEKITPPFDFSQFPYGESRTVIRVTIGCNIRKKKSNSPPTLLAPVFCSSSPIELALQPVFF
ncbi:hypothetical protein TNIN_193331 [Trichonephila inaurata madagascariensis]|uniref:Uncharacterized protein n=1 Tax=Trichonephila inaurata madagascariensis TaxID=2747483 RepID=A0A8X6WKX3_9ARAC|nr:hypothetical protein TNIN_193331 [Trichonephila inaurata madagascariensis]